MNIFEASRNGDPLPKFFWVVLDIPNFKPSDDNHREYQEKRLSDIGKGELEGIRGISDRKEIILNWFMIGRNTAIFLPPAAIADLADIEKIRYDDPDHLCENNLALLYRMYDKENVNYNYRHDGVMQNICQDFLACLKVFSSNMAYMINYNGARPIKDAWQENPSGINSLRDLQNWFVTQINTAYPELKTEMSDDYIRESVKLALKRIGRTYSDEGEWVIHSSHLKIPRGSIMLIGIDIEAKARYQEWLDNGKKFEGFDSYNGWDSRMKHYDILMSNINKFEIDRYYDIRYINALDWDRVRRNMLDKRN